MNTEHIVHVVDDDEAVRRSVAFLLRTAGYRVEKYESGTAFLAAAPRAERGIVLLDIRMPEMDGLDVQRQMKTMGIDMPVVILTGHGDISIAVTAMRAGAFNFIEKPYVKEELIAALQEAFIQLDKDQHKSMQSSEALARLSILTGRERDVLEGLVKGHPNKTIAFDLGISPRTVEIYRANMMEKLNVRSLSEALRIAFIAESAGLPESPPRASGDRN
jgi:two-component system response regulator FixJ